MDTRLPRASSLSGPLLLQNLRPILLVIAIVLVTWSPRVTAAPRITSVDEQLLAPDGTLTVRGSGFTGTTAVTFIFASPIGDFPATFSVVDDSTLEVTMPNLGSIDAFLVVESATGTAIGVPAEFHEHTINGPAVVPPLDFPVIDPIVVRGGGILTGDTSSPVVFVETGGTFYVGSNANTFLIIAEDGAAVDFTNARDRVVSRFYFTPSTIVIGDIPSRMKIPPIPPFPPLGTPSPAVSVAYGVYPFSIGQAINRTIVGDGTIEVNPDQAAYRNNTSVSLTAVPGPDHTFSGWSGDVVSTDNPLQVQTSSGGPLNITATFSPGWTLTVRESSGGSVAASPAMEAYNDGEVVSLTATPDAGFEFFRWIGDLSGTSAGASITMDSHKTVIPVFRPLGYEQLPQVTGADRHLAPVGGTVTLTGRGLDDTTAVHLFSNFRFQETATFSIVDATSLQFTMPEPSYLTNNYFLIVETATGSTVGLPGGYHEHTGIGPAVDDVGLPVPGPIVVRPGAALNGDVHGVVVVQAGGTLEVESGGITLIIAEDAAIVDFTGYGGSILGARMFHSPNTIILGDVPGSPPGPLNPPGTPISVELSSIAVSVGLAPFNAGFTPDLTIVGNGSVQIEPDQDYYQRGQSVQLTAVPAAGNTFSGWTGDVTSPEGTIDTNFSSNGVLQLTATFSTGWVLTMADSPGGSVAISPDKEAYADNEVVNLSAIPDSGFAFFGWTGDLTVPDPVTGLTMDSHKSVAPLFRASNYDQLPQITGADRYFAPIDGSITLTGSGFTGTTALTFFANWQSSASAAFTVIDDNTLELTMPDLPLDAGHYILVETATGSTITVPGGMHAHTGTGPAVDGIGFPIITPIVVRPGATLSGDIHAPLVVVETGGTLEFSSANYGSAIVLAEDAAVLDFSNFTAPFCRTLFYHSPATVIVGTPPGLFRIPPIQPFPPSTTATTSLKPSPGLDQFHLAVTFTPGVEGPGSVAVNPQQSSYASGTEVTVTATPNPGAYFIRWIGSNSSQSTPITLRVRKSTNLTARFSLSPDYFTTWRPEHFTTAELSDLGISGLDADPDGDLLTNAAEYAFGSDPRSATGNQAVEMQPAQGDTGPRIHAAYVRPKNALDVDYRLLLTTDFVTWNENGDGTGIVYTREMAVESIDDDLERVTLELYPEDTPPGQIFLKLTATIF